MSELPVESGTDSIEARAPRIGRRRLDLTIASIAIVISLISLGVGYYNAESQQKMVAATSWPFLVYETSRSLDVEHDRVTLRISNQGVGPARLKSLEVRYGDTQVHGLLELLTVCCGLPAGTDWDGLTRLGLILESRPVGLYRPGDGVDIVVLERTADNAPMWDKLADARLHLAFKACYCSVLGDCWTSDLDPISDPEPVESCPIGSGYRE